LKKWQHFPRNWGEQENAITAAYLYATVKDHPPTSLDEIVALSSNDATSIVAELTDNKSLSKAKQKLKKFMMRQGRVIMQA